MKNKFILLLIIVALGVVGAGIYFYANRTFNQSRDEDQVRNLVVQFGAKLRLVDITAPKNIADKAIQDNLSPFISEDVMSFWVSDPTNVPGAQGSSVWPDRIDILSLSKNTDGSYDVQGKVVMTSSPNAASIVGSSDFAIAIIVRSQNGRWIITGTQFTKSIPL